MEHLALARSQMAFALGFHIIFASISMVMPFLMALSYWQYLRHRNPRDLRLTKVWMKGSAILFATGAVTGTALSFQLGLLWPGFMEHAGPIIGMPFSLEGAFFFMEAIFLGLFLYGWKRIPERLHLLCGLMVGVTGLGSGLLVIAANGWMNAPSGFVWTGEGAVDIHPWRAFFNEAWLLQAFHMLVAAFQATGIAAIGLHCFGLLRNRAPAFHRRALLYLTPFFVGASLIQPMLGDLSAKAVARRQPEKLAAMEAHFETGNWAPLLLGGIPDEENETVKFGLPLPGGLSFLAFGDPRAEVLGLDAFAPEDRPPVAIVHFSFQIMVAIGTLLALVALGWVYFAWKRIDILRNRKWLWLHVALIPAGFLALEAGWVVTEVGRQPWVIYRVLRTAETVTPVPGIGWAFAGIVVLYSTIGLISLSMIWRWFAKAQLEEEALA